MPFQPAVNAALIEWVYDLDNQVVENTYHVEGAAPFDASELLAIATAAYNWWASDLAPTISFDVTLLRVDAKGLDDPTSPLASYAPGALAVGGAGVNSAPNNVAFCIKHTTAVAGRSGRGRWYLMGIPKTLITNSALGLAQAALYTSAFPLLDADLAALSATPVIVSRQQNNVVLPAAVLYPITGHSFTDNTVDSQRRRLPGRGT